MTPLETPTLELLFTDRPTERPRASLPDVDSRKPLPPGIHASCRCGRCRGVGRCVYYAAQSTAPGARRKRVQRSGPCPQCDGRGYTPLDAHPGAPTIENHYEMPEVPDREIQKNCARRALGPEACAIGRAWYSEAALDARRGPRAMAPLYPWTRSGPTAYRLATAGLDVVDLLDIADREAAELLAGLESSAEAAMTLAENRTVGRTFGDTLYMGAEFS